MRGVRLIPVPLLPLLLECPPYTQRQLPCVGDPAPTHHVPDEAQLYSLWPWGWPVDGAASSVDTVSRMNRLTGCYFVGAQTDACDALLGHLFTNRWVC